ncbi:hypothetical protein BDZ97DRAFT_259724 [Flammula alnicola]|nr:hypothetical protein BDZ97DRAFT_259724 [Flammula alnicola]
MMGSPSIDSLPHELLEKIFEIGAYLPMAVDENYPHRPLFSRLPLSTLYPTVLSQVCIRWRETVIQMPVLWSFIHLTRSLDSHRRLKSDIRRSLEWLPTYLIRSANLPLHIILDNTRLPVVAAVNLISPHSTRWCTFTLLVSHVGNLPPILPLLVRTRVPRLQHLAISSDIYREGIVCYDPFVPFFVSGTPELTTIHLNGVYVAWNALPLANLQNLELNFTSRWPSFAQLQEMFDASPMLRRLTIHDDITSILRHVEQPESKPTVQLSNLKHLEIEVYRIRDEPVDLAGLLGLFSMPSLQTLILKGLTVAEWVTVTDKYDLPPNALNVPIERAERRRDRSSHSRLTQSFPFLSALVVTATSGSPRSAVSQG